MPADGGAFARPGGSAPVSQDPNRTDPHPAGDPLPEGEETPPPGTRAIGDGAMGARALMALAA